MAVAAPRSRAKLGAEDIKKMRERDHKVVKGRFRCYEPVGGTMTFVFKKYKGDEVLKYTMVDGEIYDVPRMVAKHLNQNCWYPKHKHVLDANGNPIQDIGKKVKRCGFESLEFDSMGPEDEE